MQRLHHENELIARILVNNHRMAVFEEETWIPVRNNGVSHMLAAHSRRGGLRASQNRETIVNRCNKMELPVEVVAIMTRNQIVGPQERAYMID